MLLYGNSLIEKQNKIPKGSFVNSIIQLICKNYISEVLDFFDTGAIPNCKNKIDPLKTKSLI